MDIQKQNDPENSDLDLIMAAKEDPEAFVALYDKYLTPVYRYFLARVSHVETAEDLTSQTMLQAFRAFARYEPKNKIFGAWLFTIAHNILVNNYRKPKTLPIEEVYDLAQPDSLVEEVDLNLSRAQLVSMIDKLPARDKEILMLRSFDDLSFNQIGQVLNISETAARTAYHRAVQKLASRYQENMNYATI